MIKSLMSLVLTVGMIIILTSCTGGYKEYDGFEKDREAVRNSDAAYLLDPGFEITEDNLRQVIHDLFIAPGMLYFRCIASGPENGRRTGDSDIEERLDRAFDDLGQIRSQPRQDLPESAFSVLFQTVVANFSVNRYESGMTGILIELWERDHEKAQSSYFFTVDGDVYAALETILSEPSVMAAETIQSLEEWMH